jgi:hypothetical protein
MKATTIKKIYCDKEGCGKIIGHKGYNGRIKWYNGTHQWGDFSTCSEEHLEELISLTIK